MSVHLSGRFRAVTCVSLVLPLLAGCGYMRIVFDTWQTEYRQASRPSQVNVKRLEPERCVVTYGELEADSTITWPVLVAAVSSDSGEAELVDAYSLAAPGIYTLYLPPGRYHVGAYSDLNADGTYSPDECVGEHENGALVEVQEPQGPSGAILTLPLAARQGTQAHVPGPVDIPVPDVTPVATSEYYPPGAIRSLDDEIFSAKYGQLGIYDPAAFLARAGLYFYALTERDMDKTPVVFVHGMGGSPREFAYLIEHMDLEEFDPWFFYYPGGERLSKTSDIFHEIFLSGRIIDMRRRELLIVAHSMGGVVVRNALNRYAAERPGEFVKLFATMCTPFGGNEAASASLDRAPVVVGSWRDIAAGSEFMQGLHARLLPPEVDFRLCFAYRNSGVRVGENSDGTITLKSQLRAEAQAEATAMFGVDETHTGVLTSAIVSSWLNALLEKHRGRHRGRVLAGAAAEEER